MDALAADDPVEATFAGIGVMTPWPGQAISYKVGEQAILDLRAQHRPRPDFDEKAFHAKVLAVGSVGLDPLREQLEPDRHPATATP